MLDQKINVKEEVKECNVSLNELIKIKKLGIKIIFNF